MRTHISPNFTDEKLDNPSIEDLIDVFEDRTKGWLLEPARSVLTQKQGFFAAICLLLTYFEGISIYLEGKDSKGSSNQFFVKAFIEVFKTSGLSQDFLTRVANVLYEDARCGFFHDGMPRERIYVSFDAQGVLSITVPKVNGIVDEKGEIKSILINPARFLEAIESHFLEYVSSLRDSSNAKIRTKFKQACDEIWKLDGPYPVIGIDPPESKI